MRILIADDEAPARGKLLRWLDAEGGIEIVKTCENGTDALESIKTLEPDVAFLDIQMPGLTGLQVVQQLPKSMRTKIVFVTAFNEHAVDAFELHALDYLLKPFTKERLMTCLTRLESYPTNKNISSIQSNIEPVVEQMSSGAMGKIPVPLGDRFKLLDYSEVYCIEVEGRHTFVYTSEKGFPVNLRLDAVEKKLPNDMFLRVSRGCIINMNSVKEVVIWFGGKYKVVMLNGKEIISSREKGRILRDILKF